MYPMNWLIFSFFLMALISTSQQTKNYLYEKKSNSKKIFLKSTMWLW